MSDFFTYTVELKEVSGENKWAVMEDSYVMNYFDTEDEARVVCAENQLENEIYSTIEQELEELADVLRNLHPGLAYTRYEQLIREAVRGF